MKDLSGAKAYHKRVELLSAIKTEYTLKVKLKPVNTWEDGAEDARDLERILMTKFTFDDSHCETFSLSPDIHTYGIITITAKTQGELIRGLEYIEDTIGNTSEVVLA